MGIQRYLEVDVQSLSREKLLVLLYEKMANDLLEARLAIAAGDRVAMAGRITHSQQIITELHTALDHSVGGEISLHLASLYDYLFAEHLSLLVDQDPRHVDNCLVVIAPLLDAWRSIPPGTAEEADRLRARHPRQEPTEPASNTSGEEGAQVTETGPGDRRDTDKKSSSLFSVSA